MVGYIPFFYRIQEMIFMYQKPKRTKEKENTIQEFTVRFFSDRVDIDGTLLPIGQVSTEILNLPNEILHDLQEAVLGSFAVVREKLFHPDIKKDLAVVTEAQDKLNRILQLLFTVPPFCYMDLDKEFDCNFLLHCFKNFPDEFLKMVTIGTRENCFLADFFGKLCSSVEEIIAFKSYVDIMLTLYFEHLKKRNSEHYAIGVFRFLEDTELLNNIAAQLPQRPSFLFLQRQSATIEYTPMPNPENKMEYTLTERMMFQTIGAFLHIDFFRGLMSGNAPRRCHNCGTYFLLTEGYNTRYCNNIAPGETERTCRKVGAHRKASRNEGKTPVQVEYDKVYNRLKTRKRRGKISVDEWNAAVAKAQDLKDQAGRGEISEFELKRLFYMM